MQLIKGEELPLSEALNEEDEYDALPGDGELPPETRLIQGLGGFGNMRISNEDTSGNNHENQEQVKEDDDNDEEELVIEPLGADSDSDDDRIVEV